MAYGTANIKRYFDTNHLDLTTAGTVYKIVDLRGGEAVIIKGLVGNTGNIYVGNKDVTSSIGFELEPGGALKIEYSPDKVVEEHITLYATSATSGDDLCYIIVP